MTSYVLFAIVCIILRGDAAFNQNDDIFVSFSAGLEHNVNLTTNSTIVYTRLWINTGQGYNSTSGVFTCPHAGTYVFFFHGLSQNGGQMWLDLYRNDVYEISGYAHKSTDYSSAGNSVVLNLRVGDRVYIRGHGSSQLYGTPKEIHTTFSGYILIPDEGQE